MPWWIVPERGILKYFYRDHLPLGFMVRLPLTQKAMFNSGLYVDSRTVSLLTQFYAWLRMFISKGNNNKNSSPNIQNLWHTSYIQKRSGGGGGARREGGCREGRRKQSQNWKRWRSPGIDSEESIKPANVSWRAGTSNRVVVPARQARFLGSW